ncbi:MAG: hypothetical protein ACYC7L_01975 [Nitrospirota bacterium]
MSRENELNSRLAECRQIYKRLEEVGVALVDIDLSTIPEDRRRFYATAFYYLLQAIDAVAHLLKEISLDSVIQNVAPQPLQFYRDYLAPNRMKIERLFIDLLGFPNVDLDQKAFRPDAKSNPVWNILSSGLDFWELDDTDEFSEEALKATNRLIYSSFFRPDEWLRNADEIEPVLGAAAEQRIPSNIRFRLKELYRSFILGNYLSVIALSRAVLEYALVDRSAKIGINPLSDDPRYPNRVRKLGLLVEDVSERRPELQLYMESIVDAGNMTLHPKKKDNLVLLPNVLREYALTSIKAVRGIVEKLYLET